MDHTQSVQRNALSSLPLSSSIKYPVPSQQGATKHQADHKHCSTV